MTSSPVRESIKAKWALSHRADPRACALADRHYSRQQIGSPQFVPPGRCMVLLTPDADAVWTTSWPFAEYVRHAWAGAWMCSIFRNESPHLSSELIREAVSVTRWHFGEPPELGMVTFIDRNKTKPKRDPGYCYLKAGFKKCGFTKGGLYAVQMLPAEMPEALAPLGSQFGMAI